MLYRRVAGGFGIVLAARALLRRWRAYDLRDKVVLVTGGSRGLGLVLARQLVAHGARVAICARDPAELERARAELVAGGSQVLAVTCDLTDPDQIARMVADVKDYFGPIDVLVNNAGVIDVGPVELMTIDDYQRAMAIHLWAPLHLMRAVVADMRARGGGRIVNITSIGGRVAVPHLLPYTASKFALVGLSEGMHEELAKDGIVVTTVVPGLMRTGSPERARFKGQHRAEYAWFVTGGSLRLASMDAERAAKQIIAALRHGRADVVLSIPARMLVKIHALAPRWTQRALAVVNRLLPKADGSGLSSHEGRDSHSRFAPSLLTRTTARAARRNNEL